MGIILFLAGAFVEKRDSVLEEGRKLWRNSYGQGEKEQELFVEGLTDGKLTLPLQLRERQYSQETAETAFTPAYETLTAGMLLDNEALDQVRSDLNMASYLDEYGMAVEWDSDNKELVDTSGHVFNGDVTGNGQDVYLTACLKAGKYSRTYVIKITVYPPVRTGEEAATEGFMKFLASCDERQSTMEQFTLPEEYEGRKLTYEELSKKDYWLFPVLGILGAALIPLRKRQNEQKERKQRERQLLLDYSEIVSKLVVFLGAGLPVRRAWERIVQDYRIKRKQFGLCRYAYEEMENTCFLMERGASEGRAYGEFGNRCRIRPYRKLAGILEQNVKNGSEKLRPILEAEMAEAFEQRKTLARRMGEEAGTRLLLPLFMLLGVVMVLVSVPAFLSFGI